MGRKQHGRFCPGGELAEEVLVIAKMTGRQKEQHRADPSKRILAGANPTEISVVFPCAEVKTDGIRQGAGEKLPTRLHFRHVCRLERDWRHVGILIHRDEILVAIHHQLQVARRVALIKDGGCGAPSGFQKLGTWFPVITQLVPPVANRRPMGPERLKRFQE